MSNQPLSDIALSIAKKRYFVRDEKGNIVEDWHGLVTRVVNHVCGNESEEYKQKIFDLIYSTKFLPNSPCLVNAGRKGSSGIFACFVSRSPGDSWEEMCRNIKTFGDVARRGGGNGISLSNIRPEGAPVFGSTHAKACGPIEHMRMISEVMSSITQSGFRGMACMATLNASHPDIEKFIKCKQRNAALKSFLKEDIFNHYDHLKENSNEQLNIVLDKFISNFNISVFASDEFMKAVINDENYNLVFSGKVYKTIKAREIFQQITLNAWKNGDPGLLFEDTINNCPYKFSKQKINATNPCGEQCLPDGSIDPDRYGPDGGGSCNLGSIAVNKFVTNSEIDWESLKLAVQLSCRFLDNAIDANKYPSIGFENWAKDNRPIGLGVMGWADLLLSLKISYGSEKSLLLAKELIHFMHTVAHETSVQLAKERGSPKCCDFKELDHRRNVTLLSIAPTGTISLLSGCSSSIEPVFSPTIYRYDNTGSYQISHPDSDKDYFKCALDKEQNGKREVSWKEHILMQAAFQKYVDSAVSKTINMPNSVTIEDVHSAYILAWQSGLKGITIYRDGCKTTQVLNTERKKNFSEEVAIRRPTNVACDIHKVTVNGKEWHIIVGKVNDCPYEIFAVNGKITLPEKGAIVKKKKRHYSLLDLNDNVLIENLNDEEELINDRLGLETRRLSLELRHGIHPRFIAQQIDKSNESLVSFSKAVSRIIKKHYLTDAECASISLSAPCPMCIQNGKDTELIFESGCQRCPVCAYSKCG